MILVPLFDLSTLLLFQWDSYFSCLKGYYCINHRISLLMSIWLGKKSVTPLCSHHVLETALSTSSGESSLVHQSALGARCYHFPHLPVKKSQFRKLSEFPRVRAFEISAQTLCSYPPSGLPLRVSSPTAFEHTQTPLLLSSLLDVHSVSLSARHWHHCWVSKVW